MGNIEGLKKEVDEIKNSLNALKNNVSISDSEKKSQIESIKSQAEIVKEKIQKEISSLENKGDDISKQAKEKAQALLGSFDKITSLYNSITNTPKNEPSIQSQQPETESKDIFSKAKDWIGEQRDNVWDEEKWKTEGGKNLLRTAGFMATGIGAVSLAYKGIKKLLGRGKDEDENDKEDDNEAEENESKDNEGEKSETNLENNDSEEEKTPKKEEKKDKESRKKSFWDTGLGKTLAWLGIGSATGGGIYFLGKKFNRWNNSDDESTDNSTESADSQAESANNSATDGKTTSTESSETSQESQEKEPEDNKIVSIKDYIKDIQLDMRYATTNNFTGQKIYENADAKLRYGTIKKLKVAQDELSKKGYSIKIWDAYRPNSAQKKLRKVRPNTTLVARPYNPSTKKGGSNHTKGNTVDITLVKSDGTEIPMPSEFDDNDKARVDRNYLDLNKDQRNNAKILEDAMKKAGFNPYYNEWWHYSDTKSYPMEAGD